MKPNQPGTQQPGTQRPGATQGTGTPANKTWNNPKASGNLNRPNQQPGKTNINPQQKGGNMGTGGSTGTGSTGGRKF